MEDSLVASQRAMLWLFFFLTFVERYFSQTIQPICTDRASCYYMLLNLQMMTSLLVSNIEDFVKFIGSICPPISSKSDRDRSLKILGIVDECL